MTDDLSTEGEFRKAFDLYENDMTEWDVDIYLEELEMLYNIRERINRIILKMKNDISKALEKSE